MHPTVILEHRLSPDEVHFDWLIARDGDWSDPLVGAPLISFRLAALPSSERWPRSAVRIADHRRRYLAYEGPVSGNRGGVTRVLSGEAVLIRDASAFFLARVDLGWGPIDLLGRRVDADLALAPAGVWRLEDRSLG